MPSRLPPFNIQKACKTCKKVRNCTPKREEGRKETNQAMPRPAAAIRSHGFVVVNDDKGQKWSMCTICRRWGALNARPERLRRHRFECGIDSVPATSADVAGAQQSQLQQPTGVKKQTRAEMFASGAEAIGTTKSANLFKEREIKERELTTAEEDIVQSIAIVVPVDDDGGSDGDNACRLVQDANAPADLKRERHAPAIASNSEMTDIGDRYADVASHDAESGPQSRRPRRECAADEASGASEAMSARTQHQQQIYEEYEGREMARKVREIRNVCPTLDDEEAQRALRIFDGNEDEAAEALTRL